MGLISSILGRARIGLAKALAPDVQAWMTGRDDSASESGATMAAPYRQSTWVYTAVSAMAETLGQIPFRISRVGSGRARQVRALRGSADPRQRDMCRRALGEDIIESGPVVDLFERPHPTMPRTLFWEQLVSWDALRGEFFIVALDDQDGIVNLAERSPRVSRLLTLAPEMFSHVVTGYELMGWRFTGSPQASPLASAMLLPSEVVQGRLANPYLYWRGLSPLTVAMLPASADYAAAMFMKGLLMNNADTGIIATTEQTLTDEQREQFVAALRERKRKAGTPDRPLFLSSGVKIEKPTISNVDMQFLETRKLLRQEVGAIFKVPESLMGFSESKASSLSGGGNALNEEKLTFLQANIGPKCHRYEAALDAIVKTFGDDLVGWFDLDSLPIMQESRRSRVDSAVKVFSLGVPFNDINRVYDLGFREYAWGETGYLPFNLQPAGAEQELPGEEEPSGAEGETDDEEETPIEAGLRLMRGISGTSNIEHRTLNLEQRGETAALWRRHVRARAATTGVFRRKISRVLNEFRVTALEKLSENAESRKQKAEIEQRGLIDLIFNAVKFGETLRAVLEIPMTSALQAAGDEALKEVGENDPWKMPPKFVTEFVNSRTQPVMGVGGTVRDRLNTTLEEGIANGESTAELAGRVKEVFNDMTDAEAMRVARTETNIAYETARDKTLADVGITHKAWLSSHGPRVRAGHAAAEEAYIDAPIPSDEPFIVDLDGEAERLMFPGDTSLGASLGNIINCQCVRLAAEKQEEDEKSVTYLVHGFGEMRVLKGEKGRRNIQH